MDAFVDRLFQFIAFLDLSQNKFEEKCGLTHTNIRALKQGPTASYLMKIITAFPELSLDWLFRGTGNMLMRPSHPSSGSTAVSIGSIQTVNIGNWGELVEMIKGISK